MHHLGSYTQGAAGALLALLISATASAELYQWTDENGRVHFGDRAPDQQQAQSLTLESQPQRERFRLQIKSTGFTLSDAAMNRVEQGLAQIHHTYRTTFNLDVRGVAEVNLYLLADKPRFDAWLEERRPGTPSRPYAGVFLPGENEVGVWAYGPEEEIVNTILHESSHVIMFQMAPRAPVWIQEGMAQYFSTIAPTSDGKLRITPLPHARDLIRTWREEKRLISLRDYLGISESQWRKLAHQQNAIPYTLAWALVYFMMSEPVGQQTLRRILHDLEKSGQWPTLETLDMRYPGGLPQLEYAFFRWAQGDMPAQILAR